MSGLSLQSTIVPLGWDWTHSASCVTHNLSRLKFNEGLAKAGLPALYDRRRTLCKDLFNQIPHGSHKLSHLLPTRSQQIYNVRSGRTFTAPMCKTNKFRDSFVFIHCIWYIYIYIFFFLIFVLLYCTYSRNSVVWLQSVFKE